MPTTYYSLKSFPNAFKGDIAWSTILTGIVLAFIAILMVMGAKSFTEAAGWVSHTQAVRANIESVEASIREAESATRGYILTGDPKLYRRALLGEEHALQSVKDLQNRIRDSNIQKENAEKLNSLLVERIQGLDQTVEAYHEKGLAGAQEVVKALNVIDTSQHIHNVVNAMLHQEGLYLTERQKKAKNLGILVNASAFAGLLLATLMVIFTQYHSRQRMKRLSEAEKIAINAHSQLSLTVDNIEKDREATQALAQFASLLQGCRTVEEAFIVGGHSLSKILPDTSGTLYLMRHSRDHAEAMGDWGAAWEKRPQLLEPHECWALRQGRPYHVDQNDMLCDHRKGAFIGSTTCVPLMAQGTDLGIMFIQHTSQWSSLSMAEAAAEQLALAIANLRLRETLRTQALRDPLTGLPNRRDFEEVLPRELSRSERSDRPVSLLALDIDHFKRFNDTFGHDAGDTLLQAFGHMLRKNTRTEDLPARLGGEEFIVILSDTTIEEAFTVADNIRKTVEAMEVSHRNVSLGKITVSIGVSSYPAHADNGVSLVQAADAALYRAKSEGRNRVLIAHANEKKAIQ